MGDYSHISNKKWKVDILNTSFLCGTPLVAIFGLIWYTVTYGISLIEPAIFIIMYLASGLSITAGYHRLFSHRTHRAAWPLRLFYAIFGAGAFQNSVIRWCNDHRRHHLKTDSDDDPYSILGGFFWAHMGWVMVTEEEAVENVEDLQADPILAWQDRHIFKIGAASGVLFPALLGMWFIGGWGGFLGGMIWGGFLRLVFVHHGTFLINSAAHYWGTQTYSTKDTSRDSPLLSLFTFGEGYHNFHHTFQADYRNGHKWYHWDPSKWWIRGLSFIKITHTLHKVPSWSIENARMKTAFEKYERKNEIDVHFERFRNRFINCSKNLKIALKELSEKRAEYKAAKKIRKNNRKEAWKSKKIAMKKTIKDCKKSIEEFRLEIRALLKSPKVPIYN